MKLKNIIQRLKANQQENSMICKLIKWLAQKQDKTLCPICKKAKADKEYSGLCWDCFYSELKKRNSKNGN